MSRISPFRKLTKMTGLLLALLLAVSASGWSIASQGGSEKAAGQRKITVISEEDFYKKVGAAPAKEVLSAEDYKAVTKMLSEKLGKSTARCHVHCQVTSDGTTCWPHDCK
jgi:hypothetical protein